MRQHPSLPEASPWREMEVDPAPLSSTRVSFSGHEADRLWLRDAHGGWVDVAGISGLASRLDTRVTVRADFDRDGWPDLAKVRAQAPLLSLYRNTLGEGRAPGLPAPVLAVRLRGGNRTPRPEPGRSPRDGYGARVAVKVGARTLVREHHCGGGFAARSGDTLLFGLDPRGAADEVTVRWPGGTTTRCGPAEAGSLLTVSEQPGPSACARTRYRPGPRRGATGSAPSVPAPLLGLASDTQLTLVTTMATWCAACRAALPRLGRLRAVFPRDALALVGLPVDPRDDAGALRAYAMDHGPAYELLGPPAPEVRRRVLAEVRGALGLEVLPATLVLGPGGELLAVRAGVPSVSEVHDILRRDEGFGMDAAGVILKPRPLREDERADGAR